MKRSIIKEHDDLQEKLISFNAMLAYRFCNLCVKAEEVALLPIVVMIEGEDKKLEEVATLAKKDDYTFYIIPHYEDDLQAVGRGIFAVHPEFKQKLDNMEVDSADDRGQERRMNIPYIVATMPEVDNNRYDVLKQGVDFFYNECKLQMDKAIATTNKKLAPLLQGESKDDIESVANAIDNLKKESSEKCEKLLKDKQQEIEDAHNKWLAEKNESDQKRMEDKAAHSEEAVHTMKLTDNN